LKLKLFLLLNPVSDIIFVASKGCKRFCFKKPELLAQMELIKAVLHIAFLEIVGAGSMLQIKNECIVVKVITEIIQNFTQGSLLVITLKALSK